MQQWEKLLLSFILSLDEKVWPGHHHRKSAYFQEIYIRTNKLKGRTHLTSLDVWTKKVYISERFWELVCVRAAYQEDGTAHTDNGMEDALSNISQSQHLLQQLHPLPSAGSPAKQQEEQWPRSSQLLTDSSVILLLQPQSRYNLQMSLYKSNRWVTSMSSEVTEAFC